MATNDFSIPGNLRSPGRGMFAGGVTLKAGDVGSEHVSTNDPLPADSLQHQHTLVYRQDGTVVAATIPIHITRGAGVIVGIKATVLTPATGADRQFTIDLKSGAQGVAFVTQLGSVITIDETAVAAQVFDGTLIGDPSYAADETLQLVIAVAGAAGAQAIGLIVEVTVREDADE